MDPPEHWTAVDQWGTTPAEQRRGEPLGARLVQEEPEGQLDEPEGQPGALATDEQLFIEDPVRPDIEEPFPVEEPGWAAEHGQLADEAGGSVAKAIRTPDLPAE